MGTGGVDRKEEGNDEQREEKLVLPAEGRRAERLSD